MRGLSVGAVIAALALTGTLVSAQAPAAGGGQGRAGGAPPAAPLTNLQVLPKDMPRAQVIQVMRGFEAALQVECGHCHVWTGPNLPTNDYASDVKPTKNIARAMLRMVMEDNKMISTAVTAHKAQEVTCATCHRGMPIPVVPTYPVPGAAPAGGAAAPAGAPAGGAPTPGR